MTIMKNFEYMFFVMSASCLFSKSVNSNKTNMLQCYASYIDCDQRTVKGDALFNCFKNRQQDIKSECETCSIATITTEDNDQIKWAICDRKYVEICDETSFKSYIGTDHFGKITKKVTCNICHKDFCNEISNDKQKKSKSRTTKKISSVVSVIVVVTALLNLL